MKARWLWSNLLLERLLVEEHFSLVVEVEFCFVLSLLGVPVLYLARAKSLHSAMLAMESVVSLRFLCVPHVRSFPLQLVASGVLSLLLASLVS